jgi:type IV pilus assembly protein PilN
MASQQAKSSNLIEINLLPGELQQRRFNLSWLLDTRVLWSTMAIIVVATVLFLIYYHLVEKVYDLQSAVNQTNQAIEKERPLLDK